MSTPCEQLERFVDGELEPGEAEAFREHLLTCERCQRALSEAVQLELRAERLLTPESATAQVPPPSRARFAPRWGRRRVLAVATGVALAASVLLLVVVSRGPARVPPEVWLAQAPTRGLQARLSDARADHYRPYDVPRSGPVGAGQGAPPPSLEALAALERQGDFRGIAGAWMVRGEWKQAAEYLARATPGPDVDSDEAVVALAEDHPDEALAWTARALRVQPRHAQALWNQGLALRSLGLTLKAAEAFEQVAALGEPGWSEEASRTAVALREETRRRQEAWKAFVDEGRALVEQGTALSAARVAEFPGLARLYLYDALRAAPTRERALDLLSLARQLDGIDGGTHLQEAVQRVAGRDFTVRGPLAASYARLALGQLPPLELPGFLERLRHSPERDLLLGALLFSPTLRASLDEYRALALETGDPWFALLADEQRASAELDQGETARAEARLLEAARRCGEAVRLDYRCGRVQRLLTHVNDLLHRPQEARQHALDALRRATRSHDLALESLLLEDLGQLMTHADKLPLAHAYLEEVLARAPSSDCSFADFVHTTLAMAHLKALDVDGARAEVDLAARCDQPPSLARAAVLADLARQRPEPQDDQVLHKALEAVRAAPTPNPADAALATSFEGRFELEHNPSLGESLLRRAIAQAEQLPETDVNGRKARAYSYTSLLFDAGRRGAYDEALGLFAAELGMTPPARCVLGVAREDERTLVVLRDASGQTQGAYDASRRQPPSENETWIAPAFAQALRPCESVDVLARPPLQGRAELLPPDVAWAYRVGPGSARASSPLAHRLVVTDIEPPEVLRRILPPLPTSAPAEVPTDMTLLSGAEATPSRVLEVMRDATEISIHTHGMIDQGVSEASFLVLSKDDEGHFTLTARDVRKARLTGHPMVLLAACYAGQTTPSLHESFGLPIAFLRAGARGVLAATEQIPDREAALFFEPVLARIREGEAPATVLRDARQAWRAQRGPGWVDKVLLFQ